VIRYVMMKTMQKLKDRTLTVIRSTVGPGMGRVRPCLAVVFSRDCFVSPTYVR
jgi:hypothetical protein